MKKFRTNERISAYRIKLILSDGENKGEMLKSAALDMAKREGLDLVEVSTGTIPVCKIMDYGKMLYDQSKAERHQAKAPVTKEIKVRYNIGDHDLQVKNKKIEELLADGHKVIFTMEVKGREKYLAGNAAKEKFNTIVKDFFSAYKTSDILDSGGSYKVTVHPNKDNARSTNGGNTTSKQDANTA